MSQRTEEPTCEDVLDAFAVEPHENQETLERYLRDFPQFAKELVDLSRELSRVSTEYEGPLSPHELSMIDSAWLQHRSTVLNSQRDPLADLSVPQLREIASQLGVPRQVVTAFRERRVMVDSVPSRFLAHLANALDCTVELLRDSLMVPARPSFLRSYKANSKPAASPSVSFERLLIDAGVSEEKRSMLLADDQ